MRYPFRDDYAVQVWREERQAAIPEYGHFYKGIFDVTVLGLVSLMVVPAFPRTPDNWPARLPNNVDIVHSEYEARLFTAALADIAITPDDKLAGQTESFPFPPPLPDFPPPPGLPDTGVLFFVTGAQYDLFSQELLQIEKHTLFANQYIRLSKVKNFESIKFILDKIVPVHRLRRANWAILSTNGTSLHQASKPTPHRKVPELLTA